MSGVVRCQVTGRSGLTLKKLAPFVGAEISGVEINSEVDSAVRFASG